jgi:hypothetical protein
MSPLIRFRKIALVAIVGLGVLLLMSRPDSPLTPARAAGDETAIDRAVQFRGELGLRNDRAYVDQIEADPNSVRDLGIGMTTEEFDTVTARDTAVREAAAILAPHLESTDTYSGMYADTSSGRPTLVINAVTDGAEFEPFFQLVDGIDLDIRVHTVDYSPAELNALKRQIDHDHQQLLSEGIGLALYGVDIPRNRVSVGVFGLTTEQKRNLVGRYGQMLYTISCFSGKTSGVVCGNIVKREPIRVR